MLCENCGNPITPEARWKELGYNYCLDPYCIKALAPPGLDVVVIRVKKAGEFVMTASEAKGKNFVDVNCRRI